MKPVTNVTITTPPLSRTRRRMESGTLRGTSAMARTDECEKITGACVTSSASLIVAGETCDRSTSMPSRFISRTTSSPNDVSPPCLALSSAASAQSSVRSEEHTSELQSRQYLVCRLLLEKKKTKHTRAD